MKATWWLAAFGVLALSAPANALVYTSNLDIFSASAGIAPAGTNLGIVTVTDISGGVNVDVKLLNGAEFVNTGGHTSFAFNLSPTTGITASNITVTNPIAGWTVQSP